MPKGVVDVIDGNVYQALMTLIDKLFDAEVEIGVFEEQTRYWFGTEAFILFTIDKLIHNLAKHIIMIATDPRTMKLYENFLLNMMHGKDNSLTESQYRQKADEILTEEENLYRIQFVCFIYVCPIKKCRIRVIAPLQSSS